MSVTCFENYLIVSKWKDESLRIVLFFFRCYAMLGEFKKASHHCTLSSEAVKKAFGSSSVEYAHELFKLSQLLFNDREVTKALATIDKATSLLAKHYGRSNPDVRELGEMKKCLISVNGYHPLRS